MDSSSPGLTPRDKSIHYTRARSNDVVEPREDFPLMNYVNTLGFQTSGQQPHPRPTDNFTIGAHTAGGFEPHSGQIGTKWDIPGTAHQFIIYILVS